MIRRATTVILFIVAVVQPGFAQMLRAGEGSAEPGRAVSMYGDGSWGPPHQVPHPRPDAFPWQRLIVRDDGSIWTMAEEHFQPLDFYDITATPIVVGERTKYTASDLTPLWSPPRPGS